MKNYPFDYNISPDNSPKAFKDICRKIEEHIVGLQKEPLLVDVDGTTIQIYTQYGRKVMVIDDYDIGAVFVRSEIDLKKLFM